MEYDAALRRRLLLGVVGTGLVLAVGYVLYRFIATFVFTLFLYYASRPIYRKLATLPLPERLHDKPMPYQRQVQAATTILVFLLPFVALLGYTFFLVIPEVQQFFGAGGLGAAYLSAFQDSQGGTTPGQLLPVGLDELLAMGPAEAFELLRDETVQGWIGNISESVLDSVSLLTTIALHVFIMLAGTYYMLTDGPRLVNWFLDTFDGSGVLREYAGAVDAELSSILFGNILNAFVTGIIAIFVFSLYNVIAPGSVEIPFAPLVGALTGLGSLIPVVGMKIVYVPVTAILVVSAFVAGETTALPYVGLFFGLTLVFVDTIPDFLVRPFVSGDLTHVGLLMFAYILGPIAFGFYGIFLGPILLVLLSQFVRIIFPYVITGERDESQTSLREYRGSTAEPASDK